MKKLFLITIFLCLICEACFSQSPAYTSVTATLTDASAQVWANASFTAEIQPPFGNPNPLTNRGTPPISPLMGFANNSGVITLNMDDNTVVTPTGSTWKFTICPNSTVAVCSTSIQVIHGASMNLSGSLSADLTPIGVSATPALNRAYVDAEITNPLQGQLYWRVSDNHVRGFNGTTWQDITGSGGGGGFSGKWSDLLAPTADLNAGMANFKTTFTYGAATGGTGAMFDITDGSNNTGTNYLLRVFTGNTSNAKAFTACDSGTVNCVEFNGSAVFQALGAAQIIATQVVNTGAGLGTVTLGSNGAIGGTSGANTVELVGNNQQLFLSENTNAFQHVQSVIFRDGVQHTHTGDTNLDTIDTITIPTLPATGGIRITGSIFISAQGGVGTRIRLNWGSDLVSGPGTLLYTNASGNVFLNFITTCWNQNVTNAQTCSTAVNMPTATLAAAEIRGTYFNTVGNNTTAPTTMTLQVQNGANGDTQLFNGVEVEEF